MTNRIPTKIAFSMRKRLCRHVMEESTDYARMEFWRTTARPTSVPRLFSEPSSIPRFSSRAVADVQNESAVLMALVGMAGRRPRRLPAHLPARQSLIGRGMHSSSRITRDWRPATTVLAAGGRHSGFDSLARGATLASRRGDSSDRGVQEE
jgi:hypothetical protein